MQSGFELARRPRARLARRRVLLPRTAGFVGAIAFSFVLATLPLSAMLWLAGAGASCAVLAAIPWPRRGGTPVLPEAIADPVLRDSYSAILVARTELELALATAPGFANVASSLRARCDDVVRMCARLAPVANRLHAYLSAHDTWAIAREAARLRERSTITRDPATARNLVQAAAACDQQLATCDDLGCTRERIESRLDNVLASLRAFTAAVVKQQTAEDEQLALAGESLSEHVDGVRQELRVLESALQLEAA